MSLEELTKTQFIHLVLLITFVTSIATGIVTTSLLNKAPTEVTQTINRVVERTVERVVPDPEQLGASVITKETTVVVKEEDLITTSIAEVAPSVVRLYKVSDIDAGTSTDTFVGLGFFVDSKGSTVTDSSLVRDDQLYRMVLSDGSEYQSSISERHGKVSVIVPDAGLDEGVTTKAVTFADDSSVQLGQTVVSLSGKERTNVSVGIVSSIVTDTDEETGKSYTDTIESTVNITQAYYGSPLINMFGEVEGIHIQGSAGHIPVIFQEVSIGETTEEVEA